MADSHEQFERWSDMFRREREKVESLRAELAAAREALAIAAAWIENDAPQIGWNLDRLWEIAAPTSAAHTGEGGEP